MPYTIDNPPEFLKMLPPPAQAIWINAYNAAHEQYNGDEGKATAIAWAAVKNAGYEKGEETGQWHKMGEAKDVSSDSFFSLIEAGKDGSIWTVQLIRSGLSANRNYYPADVLKAAAPLFEGVRALSRSDEDHLKNQKKDVKNIVGWFENVRYESGALIAEFNILKTAEWLKTTIKDAWERGKRDIAGLSIVAAGRGKMEEIRGKEQMTVLSITKVSSVDVVMDPAAGGKFLKLVAAKNDNPKMEDLKQMKKLLKMLETKAPDKYKTIDPEKITEAEVRKMLSEACPNDAEVQAVLAESGGSLPPTGNGNQQQPAGTIPQNAPGGGNPVPASAVSGATHLAESINTQLQTSLDNIKKHECRIMLKEALDGSKLPQPVKTMIEARFRDKIFELNEITAEIELHKNTLAALSQSGNVVGLGEGRAEVGAGEREKTINALDGFFAGENVKETPRFFSFREAYITITGDNRFTGQLKDCVNLNKFVEALSSSSWSEVLGDSIRRRMLKEYAAPGLDDWRKVVSDITSKSDFRTNRMTRMGGYGVLPSVAESGTYQALTSPTDEEATYKVAKYGGLETITMEMIANDDQGAIRRIPKKLGRSAAITLYRFVFDFIKDNPVTTYDAKAIFHADHSNLGSSALSASSLLAAKIAMSDQAAYGNSTEILGLVPRVLLVPSELEDIAFKLITSRSSIGSAEGTPRYDDTEPNLHSTYGLQLVVVPYWTDANDWTLVCNPMDCPTLEIGFFQGRQEPELFVQDQPTNGSVFTADKITYKIRHIYGGAILDHRGMYKAVVA